MSLAHTRAVTVERDGEIKIHGLPIRAGEHVRVFVITELALDGSANRYPLRGTPVSYTNPFEPAADPDEWEANR